MTDHKKIEMGNGDPLDDHIAAVLAKYATAEPRGGLEERVLANLRTRQSPSGGMVWWHWAGMAAAMVLLATLLVLSLERPSRERVVHQAPTTHPEKQPEVTAEMPIASQTIVPVSSRHVRKHIPHRAVMVAAGPKLDQFPSPQPLTPEELALARYVREFPAEATLIAKAQGELEKQVQEKMADANSQTEPLRIDQEER